MAHRADGLNDIFEENVTIRKKLKTKTGEIESSPTTDQEIANKLYVDSQISGENHWDMDGTSSYIYPHVTGINVALNGGWLSGDGGDEGIYIDGVGNVGIGTTNPMGKFDVFTGTTGNNLDIYFKETASNEQKIVFNEGGYDNFAIHYNGSAVSPNNKLTIQSASSTTGLDTDIMTFTQSGKVGIGTTSPQNLFQVNSSNTNSLIIASFYNALDANNEYNGITIGKQSGTGTNANIGYVYNTDTNLAGASIWVGGDNPSLGTGLFIKKGGNVGIGTTSPSALLHLKGGTTSSDTTLNSNDNIKFRGDGVIYWGVRANQGMLTWDTNKVMIGGRADNSLEFWTNNSQKMTITTGGNVGIGTTSPDSKLEVTGDVHIDGDLFFETDGTGLPYGEMYANNVTHTVDIVSADAYVEIDGDMTAGELNLETFPDDHYLQVTKAGRYLINWSLSLACASANQEVEGAVMVGGTAQTKGTAHGNMITANAPITISGTLILDLAASAQISLGVANHTGTTDVVMQHASLTAVMVGGT